tara:strand:- start:539 stop:1036 length:498 start_codon:yes stop_codon:yes gene_type:complete
MVQKRTRNGQLIDFDAMLAAGQKERAIGNMDVNAKGDVVKAGEVVKTNEDRVREYYETVEEVAQEQVSLKGKMPDLSGEVGKGAPAPEVKTADTQKENIRTQEAQEKAKAKLQPDPEPEPEAPLGESFDEDEPLGYKEVELPNGDIEMVPYYTQEDAPDGENKGV